MPYIKLLRRRAIMDVEKNYPIEEFATHEGKAYTTFRELNMSQVENTGELNYVISMIIKAYMEMHGKNYKTINDIVGVLGCVESEFYRRVVIPYEDKKIEENGDVY